MTWVSRLAWIAVAVIVAVADGAAWQAPVFRSAAEAVTVAVSVRRNNRPVTGLTAGDFALTDNGVPQHVTALSYEQLPIDTTVLLDVSGSVNSVLNQLRRSVNDLKKGLQAQDRLSLVTFNMRIHRLLDPDAPPDAMERAFASLAPGGSSAVVDALAVALTRGGAIDRRQFVVLFTDGHDSISINTPDMLIALARSTTPTVSIVLATPERRAVSNVYADLAAETGGVVVSLLPFESLGDNFRRALEQFRSSYVLTYSPNGVDRAGVHALAVKVNRPGVEVRARRSYVAP